MKGSRYVGRAYFGRLGRLAAVCGVFWLGLMASAHAYAVRVPTKGYTPPAAPNTPGGTYTVPGSRAANDPRYSSPNGPAANDAIFDPTGKARTSGAIDIAGRAVEVVADVAIASAASAVIARACFSHPLGAAACAGAGMAAWYAASRIHPGEDGAWEIDHLVYGYYWQVGTFTGLTKAQAVEPYVPWWCAANNKFHCRWKPLNQGQWDSMTGNDRNKFVIEYSNSSSDTTPDYGITFSVLQKEGQRYEPRPATEPDFDAHAQANPVPAAAANESPVPVPVESPAYVPQTVPVADPIPGSTPEDGWEQDVVKITPNPSPEPQDVEATPATEKADNPGTPEDEGEGEVIEDKPEDICAANPGTVMCEEMGEAPDDEVPTTTRDLSWSAESVGLPSGCPAPVPMGSLGALDFAQVCEGAAMARPFVVAMGALVAAGIMLAALRRG